MADAAARGRDKWPDGLPGPERTRILGELKRFTIVAHDRVKPTTRPGYEFFQDNEVPALRVFRNDTRTGDGALTTGTTKSLTVKVADQFYVEAEVTDPTAPPDDFHPDNIWQKRVYVLFEWELQDGQGIDLGIFGVKGDRMGWETSFVLPLPHPNRAAQTQPPAAPQP